MPTARRAVTVKVLSSPQRPSEVRMVASGEDVRLSEAPSHGVPIIGYDKHSKGAKAYMQVAEEILAKN